MIGSICRRVGVTLALLQAGIATMAQAAPTDGVAYVCESGERIVVYYDDSKPEAPTARLEYKGRSFEMYNVLAQSGRRFATEQGLTPDKGLQWIAVEDRAVLSEMLMDHTAPQPTPIETCKPAN